MVFARMRKPPAWLGESWLALVPIAVSLAFSAAFIVRSAFRVGDRVHFSLFDDAMVSMRYARNLAEGHGLAWNPGDPPVEGYSNLLWTLWMSVVHLFGVPEGQVSVLVMVTGALLLAVNLLLVRAIVARLVPGAPGTAVLAMLMTALFFPLAFWTLRGMEVGLMATAILASVLLALRITRRCTRRDLYLLAGVLGAGTLIRDDFVVPAAVIAAYAILNVAKPDRRAVGLALVGVPLAVIAAHTGLRILYYGDPLPNTYYLKLGGIGLDMRLARGARVLVELGVVSLFAPLALAGVALAGARDVPRRPLVLLAAVFLAQAAYSVYVGGDAWEWLGFADRYMAPVVPLLLVLAALGVRALFSATPRAAARLAAALAFVLAAMFVLVPATREWFFFFVPRAGWYQDFAGYAPLAVWFAGLSLVAARGRGASFAGALSRTGRVAWVVTGALVLAALSAADLESWRRANAPEVKADATMARYGLAIREVTAERASVAVVWAGAIPYFSRRPAVDLLGKSDPVIARGPSRPIGFTPGHTKWDYRHSVRRLQPDLIAQVWPPSRRDFMAVVGNAGYESWLLRAARGTPAKYSVLPGGRVFVRADSRLVRRDRLTRYRPGA